MAIRFLILRNKSDFIYIKMNKLYNSLAPKLKGLADSYKNIAS